MLKFSQLKALSLQSLGWSLLLFVASVALPNELKAQNIFGGEGVNWVGAINGYSQPTNLNNSDYRVLKYRKISTTVANPTDGRGQWVTTINVQSSGGNVTPLNMPGGGGNGFLFTSGPSGNQYANKWVFSGVGQGAINGINGVAFQGSTDMGLNMGTAGRYTFVLKDAGYTSTGYYVGYTTNAPVTISHTAGTNVQINCNGTALVSGSLSATPSSQEKIYVRYRVGTNDFSSTNTLVEATVSGTGFTATIPAQANNAVVYYYIFSTTLTLSQLQGLAQADIAYAALNYADNSGNNYSYTAKSTATAGAISGTATICQNVAQNITFTGTGGTTPYTFSYTLNGGATQTVTTAGSNTAVTVPVSTGSVASLTYALTGVSDATCVASASGTAVVTITAPASVNVGSALSAICKGGTSAALGGSVGGSATGGTWSDGGAGGTFSPNATTLNATYTPAAAYTGTITLTLTSTGSTCNVNGTKDLEVKVPTTISTNATPSSQNLFVGQNPTNLSVVGAGAGTIAYQWFSNTSNSSTGGTNLGAADGAQTNSYTPSTSSVGTTYYYCVVTGDCGSVTSDVVAVVVSNTNTWNGSGTADWSTASNWSANIVPSGSNDVVILAGATPYPTLSSSVAVNNISIGAGATVNLNGFVLTINGAVTGTGTISSTASSSIVTNASTSLIFASAANTIKNLTVNAGTTTLSNALNITAGASANTFGTVTVANGAQLVSNGNLTLRSNINGTARVAAGSASGNYIVGNVTVERYIPQNSKRAWRLLSVPTKGSQTINQAWQEGQVGASNNLPGYGTNITGNLATTPLNNAAGFDYRTVSPSIQSFNTASQLWTNLSSTNTGAMQTNKGYFVFVRGDRSITPTTVASVINATTLRTTGTLYQGDADGGSISVAAGKFEVVGNTYASAIDWTLLPKTGGISNTFYIWDPKAGSSTALGAYQTFSPLNGLGLGGYVPFLPGSYGNGTVGNPYRSNKLIESGQAFMVAASGSSGTISLVESAKVSGVGQNVFRPSNPVNLVQQLKTNLYTINNNEKTTLDGSLVVFDNAYANEVDDVDALKFNNAGENLSMIRGNKNLVIEARKEVSGADEIQYNLTNLRQQAYSLELIPANLNIEGLTAQLMDNYLGTATPVDLSAASVVYNFNVDANIASKAANRFKLVFAQRPGMVAVQTPAITVAPNPVENGLIQLNLRQQIQGNYQVRLISMNGVLILNRTISHAGGNATYPIAIQKMAAGTYQLEVIGKDKQKQILQLVIR